MPKKKRGNKYALTKSRKRSRRMIERKRHQKYFEKLPFPDVSYEIMRRLNSSDIYVSASVNRRWREFFSKPTIKSLYSVTPYHGSPHFLVWLQHSGSRSSFYIVVDNQGNCNIKLDMDIQTIVGQKQKHLSPYLLGVSYDGLILVCDVSMEGEKGETKTLYVFNPYVKRAKRIPLPEAHVLRYIDANIYGLCYDAASSTLSIVMIHWKHTDETYCVASIYIYNSTCEEWTMLTANLPKRQQHMSSVYSYGRNYVQSSLFSWGCLFGLYHWVGLVCFSLKTQELKTVRLPGCPFHADACRCPRDWQLIGWQDNVYVLMTCHCGSKDRRAYWRLVLSEETPNGYNWQYVNILSCDHVHCQLYNVNRSQLQLCCISMKRIDTRIVLLLSNSNGEEIKRIIQRDLMSILGVSTVGLTVGNIWPMESSNLCWPRA